MFSSLFNLKIEEDAGKDTAAESECSDGVDQDDVGNDWEALPRVFTSKHFKAHIR